MKRVGSLLVAAALLLATGEHLAQADEARPGAQLSVNVLQARNARGAVYCSLFAGEDGFPGESGRALRRSQASIQDGRARCTFSGVPAGLYAVAVLHDEDGDREMDSNFFGVPKEGWGVSNDARPGLMSAPDFKDARFRYGGRAEHINVTLRY
jgi:uncharacterized protein (DUF2141 family)